MLKTVRIQAQGVEQLAPSPSLLPDQCPALWSWASWSSEELLLWWLLWLLWLLLLWSW